MPYAVRLLPPTLSLLALALALAAPAVSAAEGRSAAPVPAADGWSAAPSGGGRPSVYAEGVPGAVLQDTLSVTNRGAGPVTVRLTGTGVPLAFADRRVRVPARTRADVPFTVAVPPGAAPGDRTGTITVRDGAGRTASVAVLLRIGGPRLSALTVEQVAVGADGITYELVNRGTTTLVPRLAVRAQGLLGPVLDRAPRTLPVELPPGRRMRLTEPWPGRPALDAVEVRLTVTAAGGARDTASVTARFVPWPAASAGAGGVLAAGALLVVRRRRSRGAGGC
ncbi:hypothetical protein [Streptomyces sp. enrichment culture]|uniref:hypothetical protein n=1 Tax=Streptomyces sp. enrichment culture TaxID=1795815 RepID=UPI003F561C76